MIAAITSSELVLAIVAGIVTALGSWIELRRTAVDMDIRERVARLEGRIDSLERR